MKWFWKRKLSESEQRQYDYDVLCHRLFMVSNAIEPPNGEHKPKRKHLWIADWSTIVIVILIVYGTVWLVDRW